MQNTNLFPGYFECLNGATAQNVGRSTGGWLVLEISQSDALD